MAADPSRIRNFSIIAHIDHGKSTLADRILQMTSTVAEREMKEQLLDSMDIERERGITIKSAPVRVMYTARDGLEYQLNLIDTPGHVDFTYEVSRSLAACEGALLVVDAAQGIEAQTLANAYLALDNNVEIVPIINKIDLPAADPDRVAKEVSDLTGDDPDGILRISAKTGFGMEEVLEAIVTKMPAPPDPDPEIELPLAQRPPRALIFDSKFDQYRGVITFIRMIDGTLKKRERALVMQAGINCEIDEIGCFSPEMVPTNELGPGEVGYIITGLKDLADLSVGDTVTARDRPAAEPLEGYEQIKPMVFCGLFPIEAAQYPELRDALSKLKLNDAALAFEPETSNALGFGYRVGFLGLLHMEIVRERLEREYDLDLLATPPNVQYMIRAKHETEYTIVRNPVDMPDSGAYEEILEPIVKATVIVPKEFVGQVMELTQDKRGTFIDMQYLSENRVQLKYFLPLAEIVLNFFDQLKSRTKGYASFDYDMDEHQPGDLVRLDILLNHEKIDALSLICHKDKAYYQGKALVEALRKKITRQFFDVPIQAAIGAKIIARETVKAKRKDVLAKCYGGDISRKRKLLEKQKKGKKRMKMIGSVEIPAEAFLSVLDIDSADSDKK
ncbi:MAG: GTP-binding protein LepA [Thermoleophilia bacterium]|nr:GTP-binding protein LepA [Thermoleophilia bacterium]